MTEVREAAGGVRKHHSLRLALQSPTATKMDKVKARKSIVAPSNSAWQGLPVGARNFILEGFNQA